MITASSTLTFARDLTGSSIENLARWERAGWYRNSEPGKLVIERTLSHSRQPGYQALKPLQSKNCKFVGGKLRRPFALDTDSVPIEFGNSLPSDVYFSFSVLQAHLGLMETVKTDVTGRDGHNHSYALRAYGYFDSPPGKEFAEYEAYLGTVFQNTAIGPHTEHDVWLDTTNHVILTFDNSFTKVASQMVVQSLSNLAKYLGAPH